MNENDITASYGDPFFISLCKALQCNYAFDLELGSEKLYLLRIPFCVKAVKVGVTSIAYAYYRSLMFFYLIVNEIWLLQQDHSFVDMGSVDIEP